MTNYIICSKSNFDISQLCHPEERLVRRGDLLESTLMTMALPQDCYVVTKSVAPRKNTQHYDAFDREGWVVGVVRRENI